MHLCTKHRKAPRAARAPHLQYAGPALQLSLKCVARNYHEILTPPPLQKVPSLPSFQYSCRMGSIQVEIDGWSTKTYKSLQHPMMNWFGGGGVWTTLFISAPNFRAEDESEQKRTRSPPLSHFLCQSSCGVGSRSWQGRLTLTRGGAVRCWLCAVHCSTNMWCLFTSTVLPIVGGNCLWWADFCHNIPTLA